MQVGALQLVPHPGSSAAWPAPCHTDFEKLFFPWILGTLNKFIHSLGPIAMWNGMIICYFWPLLSSYLSL